MDRNVVLVVMDGVGITNKTFGNALYNANTPNLDYLMKNYPNRLIKAHGTYVGLSNDGEMGNSEVGHNAMGCGQIYSQGAKLVEEAIDSLDLFKSQTWNRLVEYAKNNTMHFIGLLSDGGVHSNINHLLVMLDEAKKAGIKKVCVHALLDGRDVEKDSALKYIDILNNKINELNDDSFHAVIASGGGRMKITMDRYEADWSMVEKGWHTHVLGDANKFNSAEEAINEYRKENPGIIDQDLDSFVIVNDGKPVGTIEDHDSVVFFNFRGDRAIEISRAFDEENFDKFDRIRVPKVMYAGMLQYDEELNIPKNYLLEPPKIKDTLTEQLCSFGISEYAVSETQKFGHVTYFWNGNRMDKINEDLETYEEVPSDIISFDKKPEMKSFEITDKLIDAIKSNKYRFLRCNFPNGDMVGHTGNYDATIKAMEAVDRNIGRIMEAVNDTNYVLIVLADHGNAEEMYNEKGDVKTSHTTNPVPFIIYGNNIDNIKIKDGDFGLANLASTITDLLGIEKNINWKESMIEIEKR